MGKDKGYYPLDYSSTTHHPCSLDYRPPPSPFVHMIIVLATPSFSPAYDSKCLTQLRNFYQSEIVNHPLPPALRRVGCRGSVSVLAGQPMPARSAANWSSALHGSAGVMSDGS